MPGILICNGVIKGNGVITSKPTPVSAEITNTDPNEVVITFDQALDVTSVPATTAFTLAGKTISNVAIVGSTVVLTVTVAYAYGDVVTVDYTKPVLNPLKSVAGSVDADSFVGQVVTNNIIYPIILADGHTLAFYDYTDLSTIILDGSNRVTTWNDKLGNGHNLAQTTPDNCPLYQATGVLFDGNNDSLIASFTWDSPSIVYAVLQQITWTTDEYFWNGATSPANLRRIVAQTTGGLSPSITLYNGATINNTNLPIGSFGIIRAKFNGASSSLQVNATAAVAGNDGGLNAGNGISLGAHTAHHPNFEIKELIIRDIIDAAGDETAIYNYLKTKYSL